MSAISTQKRFDGTEHVDPPWRRQTTDGLNRHHRWLLPLIVVLLLGQMAAAMLLSASEQSPVVDEPAYIGSAASYIYHDSLRLNPGHPPLAKLISGVGLVLADMRLGPTDQGSEWQIGHAILYGQGNDANHLLWHARLPLVALTLFFGLVVFAFARDLFGPIGGVIGLGLYAFSPNIIAHGSLATNDVTLAGFLLTSFWLLWRSRTRPLLYLPLAGVAFGCALATKMSALPLFPVVFLLSAWAIWRAQRSNSAPRSRRIWVGVGAGTGVCLIAVATVWAVYLAVDPQLRFEPSPAGLTGIRGLMVDLMPFPEPYREGLRFLLGLDLETRGGYLFGERFTGNLWYYLPATLLVKTPLGSLVLWLAAFTALVVVRRLRPLIPYVLLPLTVLFALIMMGTSGVGLRYVIWMPMFLAVAAPAALYLAKRRWILPAVLALVAFVGVSSWATFPYYLPYSNEAFGGPSKTYLQLHDSNVDWGQDLRRLGEYLSENHPNEKVWLIYKGRGDPAYYGIDAADPTQVPPSEVEGILALSVMRLVGSGDGYCDLICGRTPITTIGHTIQIYRMP